MGFPEIWEKEITQKDFLEMYEKRFEPPFCHHNISVFKHPEVIFRHPKR
jgi:hypothetical protein